MVLANVMWLVVVKGSFCMNICQSCSLGLDVSVSRRSRDVFFKRLGLVSVLAKCGKVSVSVSSRTESQTSRSRLGLGPQRLVYKWAFKQIFQFLSFSYETNMSDIILLFIHSLVLYVSFSLK